MVDNKPQAETSEPNQDAGEESPQYLTRDEHNKSMNAAITARTRGLEQKIDQLVSVIEEFRSGKGKKADAAEDDDQPKRNVDRIAKLEAMIAKAEQEKKQEIQKRLDSELRQTTKEHLSNLPGIRPEFIKPLMAQLIDADKVIKFSDDGRLVAGENEEDLKDYLLSWSKSSEAKAFFQAKGTQGSGGKSISGSKTLKNGVPEDLLYNALRRDGIIK